MVDLIDSDSLEESSQAVHSHVSISVVRLRCGLESYEDGDSCNAVSVETSVKISQAW
jgi:hypothetical protein